MPNHDLRTLPTHKHLRSLGGVLLGLVCAFQVSAGGLSHSISSSGRVTLAFASNVMGGATTYYEKPSLPSGSAFVGNVIASPGASGSRSLALSTSTRVAIGSAGRQLPITVTGKISSAAMAKSFTKFARFAANPVIGTALLGLPFLVDWLSDADIEHDNAGFYKMEQGGDCAANTCYEFLSVKGTWGTLDQAISDHLAVFNEDPDWVYTKGSVNGVTGDWVMNGSLPQWNLSNTRSLNEQRRPKQGNPTLERRDLSLLEVESLLSSEEPTPGALKELFDIDQTGRWSDDVLDRYKFTNVIPHGPSILDGPSETETTPATPTTPKIDKTTKTDYRCTYEDDSVLCTEKKTETEKKTFVDPSTGLETVEETTKTSEKEPPTESSDPCLEHPNRNGCREDEFDVPDDEIPRTEKNITFEPVDLGLGGGSCPPNIVKTYAGQTVTVFNWADSCNKITTYAKPAILLMAIFTAMGIIFIGVPVK